MNNEKMLESINKILSTEQEKRFNALVKLKEQLIKDLRLEMEWEKGTPKKELTIINKMMKRNKYNEHLQKAIPYFDKFAFTDGHILFITNTNHSFEELESTIDLYSIVKNISGHYGVEFNLLELKLFVKETKGNNLLEPYVFKLGNKLMGINAQLLIEAIEFIGKNTFIVDEINKPLYTKNEEKEVVLLPVMLRKDTEYTIQEVGYYHY